ncbi:MAG: hypothetical protein ACM30F_02190 [Nitrospirota bacterium]|jgi:hypothetical protein|nr:hypothetical protein [Nitrospirota bacterium]
MIDKIFKIGLLIVLILLLAVFYSASQNDRYQVVTQYEGSIGIFDARAGVVYMLDIENDQWSVIKPFTPRQAI